MSLKFKKKTHPALDDLHSPAKCSQAIFYSQKVKQNTLHFLVS